MSIDSAISIAWDVLKYVVAPIKRGFGYVMSSESYANNLREEVEKLEYEAERLHNATEEARNNLRNVYSRATELQASSEKASKEARDLLGDFEKATKTCCYGTLPDPNCRYQFSRNARHKIEDIQRLAGNCRELQNISYSRPPPGNAAAPTPARKEGKDVIRSTTPAASAYSASTSIKLRFDSRASVIQEIMDALANNSNSVVGVHGMGGVGKSTLLADAEKRIREKNSFDWVAKADVSQNPDIKTIQEEIADCLGLSDIKKEEKVKSRAKLLRERLENEERQKKKVLIILDDLWERLDLKLVGIPCGPDNKVIGCKLLLTAREQRVLRREMLCDIAFRLGGLEDEEAKRLFETTVGGKVRVDLEPLVGEALRICAGLPFLILAIARLFIDTSYSECEIALKQIWDEETGEVIDKTLRVSYDRIKCEEAKSLLQLCAVYGVSKPSLENLVRHGVGLGLFGEDNSMKYARNRLSSLIDTLQASSLLLHSGEDEGFKIHDLVRLFVASIVSRDHPILVLKDESVVELPKDKLKSCGAICFPCVDLEELPEELDCPDLRIFLLFTNKNSLEVPYSYFNSMKNLMVLNLTGIRLSRSPSPFQFLEKLHTLCLDHCSLEDVAILGELKQIQILSIRYSNIDRLPKEIGQLTKLRLLDLNYCSQLGTIEPGVLGSLMKLEELYMQNSFHQWNAADQTPPTNASLIELNNMKNLYTLRVSIPNSSALPEDLNVKKLTRYRIKIGTVWRWECKGSCTLELRLDPLSDVLRKGCIQSILSKTDDLFLEELNGSEQSICALSPKGFPELKHLQVKNSSSVHYILQSPSRTNFKALESLLIKNLINLEKICHGHISFKSFSTLKVVRVESCDKMEVLFPLSVVSELQELEEIEVVGCKLMRGIVEADDFGKVELSNLRVLKLRTLPNIKNFFNAGSAPSSSTSDDQVSTQIAFFNGHQVVFPRLETLQITGLDNIVMIWDDQVAADSFPKLKSVCVGECNRLVHVVTSSILGRILSLESLEARSCGSLKVIFKFQPRDSLDGHPVTRSPLKELELFDLPELKCVWDKELHRQVTFQCLHSVSVEKCESLTSLFPASIARDLMQFELKIKICGIVELIEKEGLEEPSINVEAIEGASHELKVILPFTSYFQHLKTLNVSCCDGLSDMFSPTMATNLVALTELRISKCRMFTEVISDEGGREGHVVAFHQLKYMELKGLTRLRCFSSGGYTLMFPLLEVVIVIRCLNMNFFSKGRIDAPKLKRVRVSKDDAATEWFWKENLNITIQNMFEEMVTFAGVNKMLLSELPDLIGKWHSELNPIKSSWQLESLTVDKCPSFIKAIPSKLMLVLDNLRFLQVRDCESLEEIFNQEGLEAMESTRVLPRLDELNLVNLPKLRRLWNKDLQESLRFDSLGVLILYSCSNLGHAFTPSMARCLAHLRKIEIKECGQMEGVITDEEGQGSTVEKITFPNLEYLTLECLPNLTSFLLGKNHTLDCPKLEELTIAHCPKMKSLTWQSLMRIDRGTPSLFTPQVQFPQLKSMVLSHMDNLSKIWTNGPQETLTFDYLGEVEVQNCKSLENLFPHWVATSLTQLKKLRVECCGIEEIVASGDDTPHSNIAQVLFPILTSLVLHDMSRVKSFCPNFPTLNWPFMEELRVTHCDKLNTLSFATSMTNWAQRDDQQDLSYQEAESSFERDFPNSKRLLLVDKDVQMIRDGKFPDDIFGKPKALTLACFHDESAIFPSRFLLERFQNLQNLEIFCCSFEDILLDEGLIDEGKHPVLENLRELKLSKLHNLQRVWSEDYLMAKILRSIETFEVWDCPCLTTIFPTVISFQNLTKLVVKNSSGLVHLVTVSAITNLVHLIDMTIIGCEKMKEVVANDENGEGNVISLEKLGRLTLQNLPSLECFSSATSCSFRFPSLEEIEVEECPKMKIFSKGTLSTPELSTASLFRYKWRYDWEGDLNATIQKLSA
ncbi:uncharacterized protein LOC115661787 [Syzygium oleosum]|uniref:uncharacterized protein LOC115661787 n=1 Tax=Syzygium oleosum TaxID=219896 RepID=UPI0011D25942|nr:uncharacterized protein LOC115661787 [Syzygium oleosum]XP_056159395.1 uncharacterized protein LOC115661787 [Syzygium oleosum]XP_056159396.1 uncharacterized protein LOC115661787 [Syzygium oleosum]XP_056159397.1 uncharacterized protein LOC115661787 [Syzygium oleosum]XP_056159398.1 uncharacterized protein LOC115661787 [Syzygium oleosum]XP_056159399.1 uncharacterized protein LOC115661787 [Syzygium oleosum]XP_056159400.1 uncharacterized protein LOC115661787 [Syzygium oleosum]